MPQVILDTSSLTNFIEFSYRFDYSKIENSSQYFYRLFPILEMVENVVETLILYDDVFIDELSLKDTIFRKEYEFLEKQANCHFLQLNQQQTESLYQRIFQKMNLNADKIGRIIDMTAAEHQRFTDLHGNFAMRDKHFYNPDNYSYPYYGRFFEDFKQMLQHKELLTATIFTCNSTHIELAFYHIVRYLYYLELQALKSTELVLHPNRNYLIQSFSEFKRLYTNQIIGEYESIRKKCIVANTNGLESETIPS